MAKEDAKGVEEQRARLARGQQIEAGWCFDPGRNPEFFRCSAEDERVAKGEISRSWNGTAITDLKSGVVETRDMPADFRLATPVTLQEVAEASGGAVASAGADTATTDNTPAGGGTARARTTR
jgi:hypothetical protein